MPPKKAAAAAAPESTAPAPTPAPKARGTSKKKFPVVAIITPDGIEGSFTPEQRRPLIAHLPIRSAEVVFYDQPIQYDPKPPCNTVPFDGAYDEPATTIATPLEEVNHYDAPVPLAEEKKEAVQEVKESIPVYAKKELLVQYKGMHKTRTLPEKTDVACQWCCHGFNWQPCVIPMREEGGVWEIYGSYCSPECALAGLLNEREDTHLRWEKIALLNVLYNTDKGSRIYPAPAKEVLTVFGGHLTIDAYRKTVRDRKVRIDIHMPPMVSLLATMDTKPIDFYETTAQKSFVPLGAERVQMAEEGLRLKRSKPLKDKNSTLDSCINLQIRKVATVGME
jgi:hypothetical protein